MPILLGQAEPHALPTSREPLMLSHSCGFNITLKNPFRIGPRIGIFPRPKLLMVCSFCPALQPVSFPEANPLQAQYAWDSINSLIETCRRVRMKNWQADLGGRTS